MDKILKTVIATIALYLFCDNAVFGVENAVGNLGNTIIITENMTKPMAYINLEILGKPHHLFVGRCGEEDQLLHNEIIILNNDGKSHVGALIRINLNGPVVIKCVKITDQEANGTGAYPTYKNGGVGHNFIEFYITTTYGKGFQFYVQIFGDVVDEIQLVK